MSFTSLSPAPSDPSGSTWQHAVPPARPTFLLPSDNPVAGSSKSSKRRHAPSSELCVPAPTKRTRQATPIVEVAESTSGDRPLAEQNASAAAYTTTIAGPSSYLAQEEDAERFAVTSDGGEGSVLFSEQAGPHGMKEYTPGSKRFMSSAKRRAQNPLGKHPGYRDGGDFLPEGDVDGIEDDAEEEGNGELGGDVGVQEDPDHAHEESQDQNDIIEEDEEGAEPPAWLKEPHTVSSAALLGAPRPAQADRMSRFLEAPAQSAKHPHPSQAVVELSERAGDGNGYSDEAMRLPSSYHSGDSDDFQMAHRPILERTEVKRDINYFIESVRPHSEFTHLSSGRLRYRVIDRLGEGTFSSVYLAQDHLHNRSENEYWTGGYNVNEERIHDIATDKFVALKKILATSSPQRIENELHILESLRGCRNVSQIISAFREDDQVIIILPFHRSDDFRHFYRHMDPPHIRSYMRALLRGLKDIHKRGIVHRDVKPANFLFDYERGEGVLCDFGLAERYIPPRKPTCQHAPATLAALQGSKVKTAETSVVEQAVYDARKRSKVGEGRVGFLQDDKRPTIKTNRAGTRGFRAPEVLLKCPDQTVAIDVWSAGIMLLSILTHKFPVFNSSDDVEALMEIAAIFGRPAMERCALLHNRTILSNVPSLDSAPASLTALVLKLNPHIFTPPKLHPSQTDAKAHIEAVDNTIDLCARLLRLDATKRVTAAAALRHPFLRPVQGESKEDLVEEELLSGVDGKCGFLHGTDDGKHRAYFSSTLQDMHFGQGIPASRDELCPEHEHWQTRTQCNPLLYCRRFDDDDDSSETEDEDAGYEDEDEADEEQEEDLVVEPAIEKVKPRRMALGERDTNVATEGLKVMKRVKA